MDETTTGTTGASGTTGTPARTRGSATSPRTGRWCADVPAANAVQTVLEFGPLPFDDESDTPIALGLTARARRLVAPESLPELAVLSGDEDPDDRSDTRPARARALRRAGFDVATIAEQLDVDDLLVAAWVDGVAVRGRSSRRSKGTPATGPLDRRRPGGHDASDRSAVPAGHDGTSRGSAAPGIPEDRVRSAAEKEAAHRIGQDAGFALGLGLLAGIAEVDRHALTVHTDVPETAGRVLRWLEANARLLPERVRVVLRLGPDVAGDLARHRWARSLGVEPERIALARWRNAPERDAQEVLVRVGDPPLASQVAGWLDVLADSHEGPHDGTRRPAPGRAEAHSLF